VIYVVVVAVVVWLLPPNPRGVVPSYQVRPSAVPSGPTVTVAADKGATVEELLLKTPGPVFSAMLLGGSSQ